MVGEIFAWQQDKYYEDLKTFGYYLGKLIYIMDAYIDYESDFNFSLIYASRSFLFRSFSRCNLS